MDTNRETQIFECLAEVYMEAELDVLREDSACEPLQISDRFRRRMQWIIFRERAAAAARRVAAAILAVLTVTGSLMLINEDVRAEVIRFFRRTFPTHTEYHFNDSAMEWEGGFRYYEPAWLPEGYEEVYRVTGETERAARYEKQEGGVIKKIYFYCMDERSAGISLNTENTNRTDYFYQGETADYYESTEAGFLSSFVWGNEYGCRFMLSGEIGLEEFIKIADSVIRELEVAPWYSWIGEPPEGYDLFLTGEEKGGSCSYIYINRDTGDTFSLNVNDAQLAEMIEENRDREEIFSGEQSVLFYPPTEKNEESIYIWKDEQENIFILEGSLEQEKMLELIQRMEREEIKSNSGDK